MSHCVPAPGHAGTPSRPQIALYCQRACHVSSLRHAIPYALKKRDRQEANQRARQRAKGERQAELAESSPKHAP
eukprot:2564470-Rhodomonas_salina.1